MTTCFADDLARAMAARGLSSSEVAAEANVDVEDVRDCLTQRAWSVSTRPFARLSIWVAHQKVAR